MLVAHRKSDLHFFAVILRLAINNACFSHCVTYGSDRRVYAIICGSNTVLSVTEFLLACTLISIVRD